MGDFYYCTVAHVVHPQTHNCQLICRHVLYTFGIFCRRERRLTESHARRLKKCYTMANMITNTIWPRMLNNLFIYLYCTDSILVLDTKFIFNSLVFQLFFYRALYRICRPMCIEVYKHSNDS